MDQKRDEQQEGGNDDDDDGAHQAQADGNKNQND